MRIRVDTRDLERAFRELQNASTLRRALTPVMDDLQEIVEKEPAKAQGAFSRLATMGQKRAFWAKVSAGQARVDGQGYVRTHRTVDGWNKRFGGNVRRVLGILENNQPSAPWVFGEPSNSAGRQQPFHAVSGWPRVDTVLKSEEREIVKKMNVQLDKLLR